MTLIKSISGIRGTIGGGVSNNLTPLDVVLFTSAYAQWLTNTHKGKLTVVTGRDARISGTMIHSLVNQTLVGMGVNVIDLGLSTTPTVALSVKLYQAQGGIVLTASHNPKQWNALKLLNERGEFINVEAGAKVLKPERAATSNVANRITKLNLMNQATKKVIKSFEDFQLEIQAENKIHVNMYFPLCIISFDDRSVYLGSFGYNTEIMYKIAEKNNVKETLNRSVVARKSKIFGKFLAMRFGAVCNIITKAIFNKTKLYLQDEWTGPAGMTSEDISMAVEVLSRCLEAYTVTVTATDKNIKLILTLPGGIKLNPDDFFRDLDLDLDSNPIYDFYSSVELTFDKINCTPEQLIRVYNKYFKGQGIFTPEETEVGIYINILDKLIDKSKDSIFFDDFGANTLLANSIKYVLSIIKVNASSAADRSLASLIPIKSILERVNYSFYDLYAGGVEPGYHYFSLIE